MSGEGEGRAGRLHWKLAKQIREVPHQRQRDKTKSGDCPAYMPRLRLWRRQKVGREEAGVTDAQRTW